MFNLIGPLLLLWLAPAGDAGMPADFLKSESKAWSRWLDAKTDTSWTRVPLKDVLEGEFGPADLEVNAGVMEKPVTFDATGMTRRTALWRLSRQYGFQVKWVRRDEPKTYLGLLETEQRRRSIGGVSVTTMTQVMRVERDRYEELSRSGRVRDEERIDGAIYFAIHHMRDLPFANGSSALFTLVERYKVTLPKEKPQLRD